MRIIKVKNYDEMSRKAANIISAQVLIKPDSVLGLATGGSPLGTYKQLIEWYNKGDIDFSEITSINLDEYVGLPDTHEQSYHYFMHENFFDHVNVKPENIHVPNGVAGDMAQACREYEELIEKAGGIDLQLLGIGTDGHIGFNEPDDFFEPLTHVVSLTESTIKANTRFFESEDDVPRKAITIGIKTIMQAKKVLLIVNGKNKADAVKEAVCGKVTPAVPASILQLHPDCTIIGDEEAFSKL
ncbi:MAG: glucosamine-6-phosphate deaminase [Butyrivibrio sp.]|nr:glucosamine-6-phosphate deaminase [Butyrivibrio sp.]